MFFTQNPIGSSSTEDLQDNAISFDYAMNSPAALWQDRFGKQHKTVQQALKDVGFKPAGFDFVSGGTLGIGDRDKCVFYPTDGYWYSWNGALPYVIPANSSPAPGGKKGWGVVVKFNTLDYLRFSSSHPTLQHIFDQKNGVIIDKNYDLKEPVHVSNILHCSVFEEHVITIEPNKIGFNIDSINSGNFRGIKLVGSAKDDDQAASIGINTQHIDKGPVNFVSYEDITGIGLTVGLSLTAGVGNKVIRGYFGGMVYSPITLNSAGGYGILLQGERNCEIYGTHFVAKASDRHAVYTSRVASDPVSTGNCENVNIHDVTVNWLATNGTGDESKLPFPARSPNGWRLAKVLSRGGSGLVKLVTENGPASNIEIHDIVALDMETRNSQFSAPISIGTAGSGYGVTHVRVSGLRTRMSRGTSQPAGRDCGGFFTGISQLRITDWNSTVDTGVMLSFRDCTDVLIDDIVDNVSGVNGPNVQPVLSFSGSCSKITVGIVMHNRADIAGKKALFGGLEAVTDMTCLFTRTFKMSLNGSNGYVLGDTWSLVKEVILNDNNIIIKFNDHVTQDAIDTSSWSLLSATHANIYRTNTDNKSVTLYTVGFTGTAANPKTTSFTLEGSFSK